MKKYDKMISILEEQVDKGVYIYACDGENISKLSESALNDLFDRKEIATTGSNPRTKEQNIARCKGLIEKRKKAGVNPILAFDCSGFMHWAGAQIGVFPGDISANGIYGKCKEISKSELKRGDFIFHHNGKKATHVGMYVGDNLDIECEGRDTGCVKRKMSSSFNKFGRLEALQGDIPDEEPKEPTETIEQPTIFSKFVVVKGSKNRRVNVRSGNGKNFKDIGTAHGGDSFVYLEQADSDPYWYKINYKGKEAYITSNSLYTEVIPCD